MKKEKEQKSCGCGENCTCGDNCECTQDNKCNENCTCGEHNCTDKCDCGCNEDHEHCDCGCEEKVFESRAEEFKAYQEAFDKFEAALEKIERELTLEKARADKNEHLADSYKKDLDRFKERNKDIVRESKLNASIQVAEKLLPVLDNFGQALKSVKDENVMIGFKMIENGIANILLDMEIVEIKAEGEKFDPTYHDAVNIIKTEDPKLDSTVANVYKKGYKLLDDSKVIRHAQVEIYKA